MRIEKPVLDSQFSKDLLQTRRGKTVVVLLLSLLFLAPRLALLFARDPFYDELFTQWIAARPPHEILEALRLDSGPPVYYLVAHLLGLRSIVALRLFSLACAAGAFAMVLAARRLGNARFTAAALLAVYPAAALFAADARSYALCAFFAAAGLLLLDRGRRMGAVPAFLAAAYTHFYGVLFFPLLLRGADVSSAPHGESGRDVRSPRLAFAIAIVLFLPGFYLASIQPREAMAWLAETRTASSHFAPLANLSFAARYPPALFPPLPVALVAVSIALHILSGARALRYAGGFLIPVAAVVAFSLAGRPIYFPMRFESVIAIPLLLWTAVSLGRWRPRPRALLAGALLVIGIVSIVAGVLDHLRRPLHPYREAALFLRRVAGPDATVVASGYCYLEALTYARARVVPFVPDQGTHPGWRARVTAAEAKRLAESNLPEGTLFFIGESLSPETRAVWRARRVDVLYGNRDVVVARLHP